MYFSSFFVSCSSWILFLVYCDCNFVEKLSIIFVSAHIFLVKRIVKDVYCLNFVFGNDGFDLISKRIWELFLCFMTLCS